MVFSTALSPFLMGWMLDNNIAIESILMMAASTVVFGVILAYIGLKGIEPHIEP
jgi:hypothetical protein